MNNYWEEILEIVSLVLVVLDGGSEADVNGFYFKIDGNQIIGWKKSEKILNPNLIFRFVFGGEISINDRTSFKQLTSLFIDNMGFPTWEIDEMSIKRHFKNIYPGIKEGSIIWASRFPNKELYGKVEELKVVFSDGNVSHFELPWQMEEVALKANEALLQTLTGGELGEELSLVKTIDFDGKVNELIAVSKIRDILS